MTRKYGLLAALWTLLIIVLLCLPSSKIPQEPGGVKIPGIDLVVHVILFSVLQFLWVRTFYRKQDALPPKFSLTIGIRLLSFGIAMEFVQHFFIPKRSFEWEDIVADAAGILIGHYYLSAMSRWQANKKPL